MGVSNGQDATAANFNAGLMSRTTDTDTTGKVDLLNTADAASGPTVTNQQRETNSLNSFTGRIAGSAHDVKPVWVSNAVGLSTDDLQLRADALTSQVGTNVTDIASIVASTPFWSKVNFTHTSFQTAATTFSQTVFTLGATQILQGVIVKHSTLFAGTGITDYVVRIGTSGVPDAFLFDFDVTGAVSGTAFESAALFDPVDLGASADIEIQAQSTGADLDQSTAGVLDVWLLIGRTP
jgi:hypothetical protein